MRGRGAGIGSWQRRQSGEVKEGNLGGMTDAWDRLCIGSIRIRCSGHEEAVSISRWSDAPLRSLDNDVRARIFRKSGKSADAIRNASSARDIQCRKLDQNVVQYDAKEECQALLELRLRNQLSHITMTDLEDGEYNNSHKAFLQAIMARSTFTLDDIKPTLAAILGAKGMRSIGKRSLHSNVNSQARLSGRRCHRSRCELIRLCRQPCSIPIRL